MTLGDANISGKVSKFEEDDVERIFKIKPFDMIWDAINKILSTYECSSMGYASSEQY